ncbi:MAG: T9SS type A sorting domain-containing protein [Bacteroidales bacterium]|nr:MAG: T9SS type A sorting domain-containing protein [Bacteroidales bacterium]
MNKTCIVFLGIFLFTVYLNGQVQEMCDPQSTSVMDGEYHISNNTWGSGSECGEQCLDIDPDTSMFEVTLSTHDDPGVCSYPFIFKGCHWGWCTSANNPFPKKINEIAEAPFSWVISTEDVSGTWNAAFEAWFNTTDSGSDYDGELMIWLDYGGGASPGGSRQASVKIGGYDWDVYFAEWWVNYIAYKIKTPADSVNLDLRIFIQDAVARGYLEEDWYVHNMEAGFEIWRGGQGLKTHSYSASIVEGEYIPTLDEKVIPLKHEYLLKQNYPNPFKEFTRISYSLSCEAFVAIKIYDIYGREIKTLVNKSQQPGSHSVNFYSHELPCGIYTYRLYVNDDIVETRKMIRTK